MQRKHLIYVLLDGLGDLPVKLFKGKTPLEAARHPFMNKLAKKAKTGVVYTVGKGIAPESDVAVISMLGYDPIKTYTGRGPIEAFGAGMNMEKGDLAVRCNFATVDEKMNILDRRCGRSLTTEEAVVLAEAVNRGVKLESHPASFEFRSTVGHRAVLLIKPEGAKLSGNVSNTDPAYQRMAGLGLSLKEFKNTVIKCEPLDKTPEARRAAELLEEFTVKSNTVLKGHPVNARRVSAGKLPANAVLSRDAGSCLPKFKPVTEQYGLEFASMVEMPVERGIALLCGMDLIELPKPSGDLRIDYKKRAKMACELAAAYDVIYIHIKGPDEPAHDGDCESKKKAIELIDAHFFKNLKVDLENVAVAVTADHSTPCTLKSHSDDPVPFMISGCGIKSDGTRVFGERECSNGSLGVMNGQELLRRIFTLL
ncbi:MAG: alkaline phosphatase family protein [Candidatus Methanomethylicaceae archaeon]|jgi:2,3-bisphosphoglycerate-independent phosphoglycerate mutase